MTAKITNSIIYLEERVAVAKRYGCFYPRPQKPAIEKKSSKKACDP
jgi:hypothetical protein